jgi:hypothetical protein
MLYSSMHDDCTTAVALDRTPHVQTIAIRATLPEKRGIELGHKATAYFLLARNLLWPPCPLHQPVSIPHSSKISADYQHMATCHS